MENTEKSQIRLLCDKIFAGGGVLSVICWCVTLFWGFEVRTLLGFIVGYFYMCACYMYLGKTCEYAVTLDEKKAKNSMLRCYIIRYAGLFVLCSVSMLTGMVNFVGVLLPQFFPRIVLSVLQIYKRKDKS